MLSHNSKPFTAHLSSMLSESRGIPWKHLYQVCPVRWCHTSSKSHSIENLLEFSREIQDYSFWNSSVCVSWNLVIYRSVYVPNQFCHTLLCYLSKVIILLWEISLNRNLRQRCSLLLSPALVGNNPDRDLWNTEHYPLTLLFIFISSRSIFLSPSVFHRCV